MSIHKISYKINYWGHSRRSKPLSGAKAWPSISTPTVTIQDFIFGNIEIAPEFTGDAIIATLESDSETPGTAFVEFNSTDYNVQIVVTAGPTGDTSQGIYCYNGVTGGQRVTLSQGQSATILLDANGGIPTLVCGQIGNPNTVIINSITLIPVNQLDLSVGTPQLSQQGASAGSDGLLQVSPGNPVQVTVPVSGSGFNSQETRTTTVTLQAGSQALQTQTISLADIQSGAVTSATFTVTFDPSLAGTTQTITATIDPGNALNESNFSNNTASVQVDVISCSALINNALAGPNVLPDAYDPTLLTVVAASFTPNFGYTLTDAAKVCGFVVFDWQQTITYWPSPSSLLQVGNPIPLMAPPTFLDPPPGGYVYELESYPTGDNSYPFYYGINNGDLDAHDNNITLSFSDEPADPCLAGGSGIGCGGRAPLGADMEFSTQLVGVNADGSAVALGIGFTWGSNFNGTSNGGPSTKNVHPVDPGSGTGGVMIRSVQKTTSYQGVPTTNPGLPTLNAGTACNGTYAGTFKGDINISAGQSCTFVNGQVTGDVNVNGGSLTLSDVSISGNVRIKDDSSFSVNSHTTIKGDLQVWNLLSEKIQDQICSSTIYGDLWIHNNRAAIQVGSSSSASCGGNIIVGNLVVRDNSQSILVYGNYVDGVLQSPEGKWTPHRNDLRRYNRGVLKSRLDSCDGYEIGGNLDVSNNVGPTSIYNNTVSGSLFDDDNRGATQVFDNTIDQNLQCDNNAKITGDSNTAKVMLGQCSRFR